MITIYRSSYDPKDSDEGGIDAIGLSSMGEYLGQLYLPGLLERHRRPRFLTISAIGLSIKSEVEAIVGFENYPTTFWEAYEWVIVTGIIAAGDPTIRNLPSSDKARNAKLQNKPLSAERYLVTPSVFGFHGVYKFLLKNLGLEIHDFAGEHCQKLVHAWAKDQNLNGFIGLDGEGALERKDLIKIVVETVKQGKVTRSWNHKGWDFIHKNFHPLKVGPTEKEVIKNLLMNDPTRYNVLSFLSSKNGSKYLKDNRITQRQVMMDLEKNSSDILKKTINVILSYEQFARSINDIFYDAVVELSENSLGLSVTEFFWIVDQQTDLLRC